MIQMYMPEEDFIEYSNEQIKSNKNEIKELDNQWEHKEIISNLLNQNMNTMKQMKEKLDYSGKNNKTIRKQTIIHERKIEKYTHWIDVFRLANFHYSRYIENSNFSFSEGLFSTLAAIAATYTDKETMKNKNIAIIGCGPGRSVLDFCRIFKESHVYGLDYSMLSLCLAENILGIHDEEVEIVYRNTQAENNFSLVKKVNPFKMKNYKLGLLDIMNISRLNIKFDIVICSNVLNLMPNHQKAVKNMVSILEDNGLFIYSDLMGWRLDRKKEQKLLHSEDSMIKIFESFQLRTLEKFTAPYIEKPNSDQFTFYKEYFYVAKK